jgi:tRNA pseudouridine38-40 synthase
MRYRAILEYDGTEFLGFQRQAHGRTVQGEVEAALQKIGWTGHSILGAGRTDTGVHASGQVIAFDWDWKHSDNDLMRALNANLPPDAAVKQVSQCSADFHPRYRAQARHYRYTLYNTITRLPLANRYAWHLSQALDVEALQVASQHLLGRHDFATFGTDPDERDNTTRTVSQAEWRRANEWFYFDIQADAFLYRMVRSVVGALKRVGTGEMTPQAFAQLLEARDRAQCPPIAPAHGLCLIDVIY